MKTVITFFLFLTLKVCLSSENIIEVSLNGEFKDLLSARDYIRVLREDDPKNTYIIEIREGTYRVDEGIIFEKLDNNLIIRAAQGEQVRLVGAKSLDENRFQIVKDKEFLRNLIVSSVAQKIRVYDLFEDEIINLGEHSRHAWGPNLEPPNRIPPPLLYKDNDRQRLARWPNYNDHSPYMVYKHYTTEPRALRGYEIKVQSILDKISIPGEVTLKKVIDQGDIFKKVKGGRGGTFQVAFDRMKYWRDVENVWLDGVLSSTWEWTYNRIESVDLANRHITLRYPELSGICHGASVRLPHFYFENIPEEIDEIGEYWIDRKNGLIFYLGNEDLSGLKITTLESPMLVVKDTSNISIEGIEFSFGRNHGIVINKSAEITINKCRLSNFTKGGIDASGKSIRILDSHIHGVGAFGIRLKGGNLSTLVPADNEVINCHIHDFGWEQKSQMGGVCIYGVGHRVAHNEIHDATHFGVLIRKSNDVTVEFNEIYDLPKYHKLDGGALYIGTGSTPQCRGLRIINNYFHDIPTIGVYPDNFSWGVEISGNVFCNVGVEADRAAIDVNGGGECRTFNNLMIDCVQMYRQGTRPKEEHWLVTWKSVIEKYGNGKIKNTPHAKYRDFEAW
ncbi:MAG: right-handed parallel beta-helix repeat-containing protein, partial [Verrucomicrobiota bacterium]|nr:right-handed parallel beta-helix repeat-containing protein [Verrucomicrobiota bacterium]